MHDHDDEALPASGSVWAAEYPVLPPAALIARTHVRPLIDLLRIKLGVPAEFHARAVMPVIEAYTAYVQLLPACESARHARPGGRLACGLELALRALDRRRGQILPYGAAPEAIGEHVHRWTYAVVVAALLDNARVVAAGVDVQMRMPGQKGGVWEPTAGSMLAAGASAYQVQFRERLAIPESRPHELARARYEEWVPVSIREWLAQDAALLPAFHAVFLEEISPPHGMLTQLLRAARTGQGWMRPRSASRDGPDPRGGQAVVSVDPVSDDRDAVVSGYSALADRRVEQSSVCHAASVEQAGVALVSHGLPPSLDKGSPTARRFMAWLKAGLSDGTLRVNEPGAWVHGVDVGLLLVSPRIFRVFVTQAGVDGEGGRLSAAGDAAKQVQREVLRAGWHVQLPGGVNMCAYQVNRDGCRGSRISGVVIRDPARLLDSVPARNPWLQRAREFGQDH